VIRFFFLDELATGVVMSAECSKTEEAHYTTAAALLVGAVLWDIAVMMALVRPIDLLSISTAILWNTACVTVAWFSWRRSTQFFDLSIVAPIEPPRMPRAV
jgi:hypothetical protein